MVLLELKLLGPFDVAADGLHASDFPTDKTRALLAYLAVERGRPHTRTELATLLWGEWDEAAARANLRKSLFRLRKALGPLAEPCLQISRADVTLTQDVVGVDWHRFLALGQQDSRDALNEAAALHRGDLLAGLEVSGAPTFDEWLSAKREQLHQQFLTVLHKLAEVELAQGGYVAAEAAVTRQLTLEPWRESAHRQLMRIHVAAGRRGAALAQYDRCVAILEEELGVPPSAETEELAAAIRGRQLLTTHLHNFSAPQTQFVGRENDINRIIARLNTPGTRLVSLTGPGGVGKTRLGLEAITRSMGNRAAYFVPLEKVVTPAGLWQLLGEILELSAAGSKFLPSDVIEFLQERTPLLLLDNYEQMLPDTSVIEQILRDAPDAQLLVTSRAPLRLRAEWRLALDGLPIPPDDNDVANFAAAELLLLSGQQVEPDFALTPDNQAAVARICRVLGGMPLALEIAGSWLSLFTPEQLAQEIERNLDVLVATRQDMPERHRSLRAIFDHAVNQLSRDERGLLEQLICFEGDFALQAVNEILNASPLHLRMLLDHALLQRRGPDRFGLHPLLAAFLREAITVSPELRQRHANYYLRHIAVVSSDNIGDDVDAISRNMSNLRTAWATAVEMQQTDLLLSAVAGFLSVYQFRGFYAEGQALFSTAAAAVTDETLRHRLLLAESTCLQALGEVGAALTRAQDAATSEDAEIQLAALIQQATLLERLGELQAAQATAQRALELAAPNSAAAADVWRLLGFILGLLHEFETARDAHLTAMRIAEQLDDKVRVADNHGGLSLIFRDVADYKSSIYHIEQALALAKELNHREREARFINYRGSIHWQMDELDAAHDCYITAYAVAKEINHKRLQLLCAGALGIIASRNRDHDTAVSYYRTAIRMAEAIGAVTLLAVNIGNLGNIHRYEGRYPEALKLYEQASELHVGYGAYRSAAINWGNVGDSYRLLDQPEKALTYFERAIEQFREGNQRYYLSWVLTSGAESCLDLLDGAKADAMAAEGLAVARDIDREPYILLNRCHLARAQALLGDFAGAIAALDALAEEYPAGDEIFHIDSARWYVTGDESVRQRVLELGEELYREVGIDEIKQRLRHLRESTSYVNRP